MIPAPSELLPALQVLDKWAMQSNAYLREAQWFNNGYITKFDEYLENALLSVGAPLLLGLSHPMIQQRISKEEIDLIPADANLLRWASITFCLYDDMATSKAEQQCGDVPQSIQCYMHETGSSEKVAANHIRDLISDGWKELNAECLKPTILCQSITWECSYHVTIFQLGMSWDLPPRS
ncbi:alpha-terpineol synthase-like protein [Cinnamomum micranthum f. kanehirae]|uniref:Alpha-terpineol synthase-like protein n=1 Tax=Cinnamomum micranthum f. kanehirae TaxID=337451 RepID=A0A3S3MYF5_9MAGN|nr:alpha-terpineol synthase-like protein [Cinnamomum micranthum f. kanehirae]